MTFESVVEICSTFPSPLGGAVFKGIPYGERKAKSFRAARWVVSRIPVAGEFWKVEGDIELSVKYGDVVIVKNAFLNELPASTYIGKLLKNHPAFRGFYFGKAKVDKLLSGIGDFALVDLLNKSDYKAVMDGGLSESLSIKVCDTWSELKEETEVATFLSENKLDSALANRILRLCRYDTVARLKRNPFALIALSKSTTRNFKTIWSVAKKLNISPNDERTTIGCVELAFYKELERGNTIVDIERAKFLVENTLKIVTSSVKPEKALTLALENKTICVLDQTGLTYLQLISTAFIEQYVENTLTDLNKKELVKNVFTLDDEQLKSRIKEYNDQLFLEHGYRLNAKQMQAVFMALTQRVSILSGFGGTGKTTVLRAISDLAKTILLPVHVAALAGKAANRASQSTGEEATTIHTLINQIKRESIYIDSEPLIIIDESSMVDISLACSLLRVFGGNNVRLLFVGDTAQLPPIGFGLFYHRLVETSINQTELTDVQRQLTGSQLHSVAMAIRSSETQRLSSFTGQASGVYLLQPENGIRRTLIKLRRDIDCVILTPYSNSKYETSTASLNPRIQSMINRPDESRPSLALGNTIINENDPVMVTKNSHELGVFNGMTGVVTKVETINSSIKCWVRFEGQKNSLQLSKESCWEVGLQLAYAMTIHKSQGSEYDVCVIVLGSPLIENSALYTAVTRTKKLCILVGTQQQYDEAIKRPARHKTINCGFMPKF
jgi:exodeoxyribonuclease V alpha subunit